MTTLRLSSMSTVKRWIALVAAGLVLVALVAAFAAISFAVRSSGDGSDPDAAFSPTEVVPEALATPLTWLPDADTLVRVVEPATREQLTSTWLRSNDALVRAADGDLTGLDVWFTDAALDQARARFVDGEQVSIEAVTSHELRVDFYSLDGQVVVLTANRSGATDDSTRAIVVLADGNWRIRNLERVELR